MSEKELKMFDVNAQLDVVFGKEGPPERRAAEDRANAFFTGQIIEEARKHLPYFYNPPAFHYTYRKIRTFVVYNKKA